MYLKRNNEYEILALYRGDYRKQLFLREIARKSNIPLKTCQTALLGLEKQSILLGEVKGKNKYFTLNLSNIATKYILIQSEIYATMKFLEQNPEIKLFLKSADASVPLVIFGSYAKGTATKESDLDVFAVTTKGEMSFHLLPFNVHKIILSEKSFFAAAKNSEPLIKEIEENHIILTNHSFYVNAMWCLYAK